MKLMTISLYILLTIAIILVVIIYNNYDKIPSKRMHIKRNKFNIFPIGKLRYIKGNEYIDNNNIIWIKRGFLASLLHNPMNKYVFETYSLGEKSSSEVEILKSDFDNGKQNFMPASYNYYSSFNSPISHFFADVLPIIIYLMPKYKIYFKRA